MALRLTKTLYSKGERCKKRLWLARHRPELRQGDGSYAMLTVLGNRVGAFAKDWFAARASRCVDLSNELNADRAVQLTKDALQDPEVDTILEAAFEGNNVLIRADAVTRSSDTITERSECNDSGKDLASGNTLWDITEIKSSHELRQDHLSDIALQRNTVNASGLAKVDRCILAHLNRDFIFDGSSYENLLLHVDVTQYLDPESVVNEKITQNASLLEENSPLPPIPVGSYCNKPSACEFLAHCSGIKQQEEGKVPLTVLPSVGLRRAAIFKMDGIETLDQVPRDFLKSPLQKRIWKAHMENETYVSPEIKHKLERQPWPRYFLDFEMVQQGVPLVPGTGAREAHPFQWSVHRWDEFDQELEVEDGLSFLSFEAEGVRPKFVASLIEAVGESGPIFVHSIAAERSVLKGLMAKPDCQEFVPALQNIIDRLIDTLDISRKHFYSPTQMGSFALKNLIKAIPTRVEYVDESHTVANGLQAQEAWFECVDPNTSPARREEVRTALVRYCASDTLAMVDLLKYLQTIGK